jgi:hypothetical protein
VTRFILLLTVLFPASAPIADDGVLLRYRDLSGRMSVSVSQEIEIPSLGETVAGRDLSFDLESGAGPPAGAHTS